jgi:serine/threonine protein kinase/outer membrane murein-binding lipoprotein Lpp
VHVCCCVSYCADEELRKGVEELKIRVAAAEEEAHVAKEDAHVAKEEAQAANERSKKMQNMMRLLELLSPGTYAGMSKTASFEDDEKLDFLAVVSDDVVSSLWNNVDDLKQLLIDYSNRTFDDSKKRETWLQVYVFVPLLLRCSEMSKLYRVHGDNIQLRHLHNASWSTPDATLTRRDQFAVYPAVGGPVFELEHTITQGNAHDKENHFANGRGQVVKYLAELSLAALALEVPRDLFVGVFTDCAKIIFYVLRDDGVFHSTADFDLLTPDTKPSHGFKLLVSMFFTEPGALSLPEVTLPIRDFKGFPHTAELPSTEGGKKKVELRFDGALGFGASSFALQGRFEDVEGKSYDKVCIKVDRRFTSASATTPRVDANQVAREIEVLPKLNGITGVPTVLWSRSIFSPGDLSTVLVTKEVGPTLAAAASRLSPDQLEGIYKSLKVTLATAHSRGFSHHDVSPANIILPADDTPVLIDWGLASHNEPKSRGWSGNETFSSAAYDEAKENKEVYDYSPADDMESLIYAVAYAKNGLPWDSKHTAARRGHRKRKKNGYSPAEICKELPLLQQDLTAMRKA